MATKKTFDVHYHDGSGWRFAGYASGATAKAALSAFKRDPGNQVYKGYKLRTKKNPKLKTAKRPTAKPRTKKRSTAKNRKQTRARSKKRSTACSKSNPGAKLRSKISQMKPGSWYPTTLSGARVKVQRKGNSLVIRPASKKRSR